MIKLIASDMDGTLLNDDHMISEENLKAIRKAQEMGRHFTIVTGRDYGAVKSYLEECNLKCECILSNGAEYRDINGNIIESVYMNKESAKITFDILNEANLCIQLMTNNGSYITNKESDKKAIIDRFKLFNPKMSEEEVEEFVAKFHKERGMKEIDNIYEILESDIEITAQPPGKKMKNLNLLSGGEKALTAISILFSIILAKPTPFCILDEIEAPLDDANIFRFGEFLKELSNETQFISVTHRRGTMEAADYIYGVTMQEKAISKVLSLKLKEAEEIIDAI